MIALAEILGFLILPIPCIFHLWTEPNTVSSKTIVATNKAPARIYVDEWKWKWLNKWYGNSEDGVSGQQAIVWDDAGHLVPYTSLYPSWVPKSAIAYGWSAWRNGANNIKRPLRTDGLNAPVN
jgi:hypothetical protein